MRVDIQPQWHKISSWYWNQAGGDQGMGMSIWDMLQRDYGAQPLYGSQTGLLHPGMWTSFPNDKSYTAFLLRWS